ncbi:hypothetical protein GHK96_06675 [Vibrio cholerae]|uniref:hypothetical protein n=1 Tax=Vibrio cholerae TaxID=666 RepID=UPI001C609666|nr:hypothetical protein [Vibrio cholerae]MBW5417674.1 hypothetical protein [Vibrio cholerae]
MRRSDNPDFVPYKSTFSHGYSLRPEQIEFVRESGGSKFIRLILDAAMGLETKDSQKSQDGQKSQKLIDEVMK